MGLRERLLADYDHEIASTRRVLAHVPEPRLTWQPHARCRSLDALATHVIDVVGWAAPILGQDAFDLDHAPLAPDPITSCAEIMTRFEAAASRTRTELDRSDAEYKALWRLTRAGTEVFAMPREAAFRAFVLHHLIHHRGQLTVYLRLAEVPVPPVYGLTGA